MIPDLATRLRAQAVKQFAHRFLNISCFGRQVGELFFLFGKSKSCMKTCVDFKLEKKICRQNYEIWTKSMILLSSPLKNDPLENTVSIFFSLEIEIFTTKIVNSKNLKKSVVSFCRR